MIGRGAIVFLLALSFSEARVDFNHSKIYDEFDFKGQSAVTIDGLCKDSCRIYASITEESKSLASNLLIQTAKGFVSVADVAARVDSTTKQKLYLEVNNTASLAIVNGNSQLAAGPLVLYVVNQAGGFFGYAEIYEADGFYRPTTGLISALTVMSARPFTLKQAHLEGSAAGAPEGVLAQMAGYDALGYASDPCPYLYYLIYGPFPGFTMEVNGPIVSLQYDLNQFHFPPGDLSATVGISNKRQLERAGWVGSPGFHGCLNKQPYRSSLYDFSTPFHAEVFNEQPESMSIDVVTNSDDDHPVLLENQDTKVIYGISDTSDSSPMSFGVTTQNLTINWMSDGTGNTHFMIPTTTSSTATSTTTTPPTSTSTTSATSTAKTTTTTPRPCIKLPAGTVTYQQVAAAIQTPSTITCAAPGILFATTSEFPLQPLQCDNGVWLNGSIAVDSSLRVYCAIGCSSLLDGNSNFNSAAVAPRCSAGNSTFTCASPRKLIVEVDLASSGSRQGSAMPPLACSEATNFFWAGADACWGQYRSLADLRVRGGTWYTGCAMSGDSGWSKINCP